MSKVLYLSYDGMSDPLGQSQVLPYLRGLRRLGHQIHLVSFEKAWRLEPVRTALTAEMEADGIVWHPLGYTKTPPVISAMWDLLRLRAQVRRLQREVGFDIVHCRSYLPSLVGLQLKRDSGVRFLFDMRGFWADEKVEAGTWNLRNPLYRLVYGFFKAREAEFVAEADGIVSLTEAGRGEIERWEAYKLGLQRIAVIPCAADFDVFTIGGADVRDRARSDLAIPADSCVVAYLGSLGTWYLLGEMLDWYAVMRRRYPRSRFLVVTHDNPDPVRTEAAARGIDPLEVIVVSSSRDRIPFYLSAADIGLFFIRPSYSKQSSSPTKLGEYLAMGIPVVTNAGVGDVDGTIESLDGGVIVSDFSTDAYARSIEHLPRVAALDPQALRERSRAIFDLQSGIAAYHRLYQSVLH